MSDTYPYLTDYGPSARVEHDPNIARSLQRTMPFDGGGTMLVPGDGVSDQHRHVQEWADLVAAGRFGARPAPGPTAATRAAIAHNEALFARAGREQRLATRGY